MQIHLATFYADGAVNHRTTLDVADERIALAWAVQNWHPAQGVRRVDGPGHYLNDRLFVAVEGGEFEPVAAVVARLQSSDRKAA